MSVTLWNDEQTRPLQHIRVVDLTVMLPGPLITRILAQYGADVIKVENTPKGDPIRELENKHLFELLNQGKRSLGINLKTEEGKAIIKQLVGEADLFVESFREGIMDEMGLGYAEISDANPDLLYMSLRGFAGQMAGHSGHDLNFIANSGCGEWFLNSGDPNYSTVFGDLVGGAMVPAIKLLLHLANPSRRGMHLITNMDENFRTLYLPRAYEAFHAGEKPAGSETPKSLHQELDGSLPHSRFYRCRDNHWVSLSAVQEKHWNTFCDVVDKPDWKSRKKDASLVPEVEQLFQGAPASYWEALTANRELCLFRVVPWSEHVNYSQVTPQFSTDPLTWCGFLPNLALHSAPELGRDTFTVMHSLGTPNKEIAELVDQGILFQPERK